MGRRPLLLGSCVLTVLGLFAMAALLGTRNAPAAAAAAASEGPLETWALMLLMMTVEYAVGAAAG